MAGLQPEPAIFPW